MNPPYSRLTIYAACFKTCTWIAEISYVVAATVAGEAAINLFHFFLAKFLFAQFAIKHFHFLCFFHMELPQFVIQNVAENFKN